MSFRLLLSEDLNHSQSKKSSVLNNSDTNLLCFGQLSTDTVNLDPQLKLDIQFHLLQKMRVCILVLLLLLLSWATSGVECPASHFDFIGRYSLGKQDEVNKTFTKISEKLTSLGKITYNTSATTAYTIFNTQPFFYYRDTQQKANVLGNDTIVIFGGRLEAYLTFDWKKQGSNGTISGSGSAFGLSDALIFVKRIVVAKDGSFFYYDLVSFSKVTWGGVQKNFGITRIDPPNISDDDKIILIQMLNRINEVQTVCDELEDEIYKLYPYYLNNSLHDQHMPFDQQFDYVWSPGGGRPNVTLPFIRRGIDIKLNTDGKSLLYQVQPLNYSEWKCGNRSVPISPKNPGIYGTSQQYISYDFYQNVISYAISRNILDSELTQQNWQSRMFQFSAGDLYEVLSKIQDNFRASESVTGNCKASFTSLKVSKSTERSFNVSLSFNCELNIQRGKVVDFAVKLQLEIQGIPEASSLDFKLKSHTEEVAFYPYGDYKILNEGLGKAMVRSSLNKLYEGKLFGSGWGMSPPRDYPQFAADDNYTFVYDSSRMAQTSSSSLQL